MRNQCAAHSHSQHSRCVTQHIPTPRAKYLQYLRYTRLAVPHSEEPSVAKMPPCANVGVHGLTVLLMKYGRDW